MRLVRAATDLEVARLLEARTSWMEGQGEVPVAEGPMSKLFGTEALVRHAEAISALVGPDALRSRGDPTAVAGGRHRARPALLARHHHLRRHERGAAQHHRPAPLRAAEGVRSTAAAATTR